MREAQAVKARRRKRALVASVVVSVLAVTVAIGAVIQSSRSGIDTTAAEPRNMTDGGIVTGTAEAGPTVSVYFDYLCPACRSFEEANGQWLAGLRGAGDIALEYKPISILDRYSSTQYSTRAANAAACVADTSPDAFPDFHDAMFAAQPAEGGAGLPNEQLVDIAVTAGADATVEDCITDGTFTSWVANATDAASKAGVQGTPTVLVDGVMVSNTRQAIGDAIGAQTSS